MVDSLKIMNPVFFKSPAHLRKWFEKNHDTQDELWIGFYKKDSGKVAVTYKEALDLALCFGWIDGIRKSVDGESYTNRFTPRRSTSIWSNVNIKRVNELIEMGLMHAAGMAAFERRTVEKSGVYSFEEKKRALDPAFVRKFKANKKAWAYFTSQPPWYQRTSSHWVMSAKQEATRQRRLKTLIEDSANGATIGPLKRPGKK